MVWGLVLALALKEAFSDGGRMVKPGRIGDGSHIIAMHILQNGNTIPPTEVPCRGGATELG